MDQIVHREIASLKNAPQNSRRHSAAQIDQIVASMTKFGWTIPVLIDEAGEIIAGHARVTAARKLGFATAPCIVASGWSADQKEAYQITDNRLAELSEWDNDILTAQIKRLNAAQFDLSFLDMTAVNLNLETFNPSLTPKLNVTPVTGAAVESQKAELDNQFNPDQGGKGASSSVQYTVTCPHCGEDFDIAI